MSKLEVNARLTFGMGSWKGSTPSGGVHQADDRETHPNPPL
jgi:hypothetical protein